MWRLRETSEETDRDLLKGEPNSKDCRWRTKISLQITLSDPVTTSPWCRPFSPCKLRSSNGFGEIQLHGKCADQPFEKGEEMRSASQISVKERWSLVSCGNRIDISQGIGEQTWNAFPFNILSVFQNRSGKLAKHEPFPAVTLISALNGIPLRSQPSFGTDVSRDLIHQFQAQPLFR
jgi:hypothetical protein